LSITFLQSFTLVAIDIGTVKQLFLIPDSGRCLDGMFFAGFVQTVYQASGKYPAWREGFVQGSTGFVNIRG
jgi:hypothetical protein